MKRYRSPREVLAEVEKVLAGRASVAAPLSLLDQTLDILYHARHYFCIGISLSAGEQMVRQAFRGPVPPGDTHAGERDSAGARCSIVVPIQIGRRVLGAIDVESDREYAFGREDRVLLQRVAARLARYLSTRGKHVLRRLREQAQPVADAAAIAVPGPGVAIRAAQPAKKSVKPLRPSLRARLRPASGVTWNP